MIYLEKFDTPKDHWEDFYFNLKKQIDIKIYLSDDYFNLMILFFPQRQS